MNKTARKVLTRIFLVVWFVGLIALGIYGEKLIADAFGMTFNGMSWAQAHEYYLQTYRIAYIAVTPVILGLLGYSVHSIGAMFDKYFDEKEET